MIVHKNDSGGSVYNNIGKHLAGMNRAFVEKADSDHALFDNLIGAVQGDTDEILLLFTGYVGHQRQNILDNGNLYRIFE